MPAHVVVVVVVHAEEVDRLRDELEVAVAHERVEFVAGDIVEEVGRVAPEQQRLEERAVPERVDAARGVEVDRVGRVVRHRVRQVERDAELLGAALAQGRDGEPVREVLVVQRGEAARGARCVRGRARRRRRR